MENVAEHINEMQRIHEEYGAIFDHLYRQYQRSTSQLHELNPGDLLYYGGVEWLNISGFLGKIKKGLELHAMCFIFRTAVVFLCKERLRSKRKQLLVSLLYILQIFSILFRIGFAQYIGQLRLQRVKSIWSKLGGGGGQFFSVVVLVWVKLNQLNLNSRYICILFQKLFCYTMKNENVSCTKSNLEKKSHWFPQEVRNEF